MVLIDGHDAKRCCVMFLAYASGWDRRSVVGAAGFLAKVVLFLIHLLASCKRCLASSVAARSFSWSNFFGGSSVM